MESLPTDIWAEILPYLSYYDGISLVGCGSRVLTAKIVNSWRKVENLVENLFVFPFSAFNLPHITDLSVHSEERYTNCVLRLNQALPCPKKPIISLRKIAFRFAQCFAVLDGRSNHQTPSSLFPNLTELFLEDGLVTITKETFKVLPRTLEKLLLSPSLLVPRSELRASDFRLLPRGLVYLYLSQVNVSEKAGDWAGLPQTLKTLIVHHLGDSQLLKYLPPAIEEVIVPMWYSGTSQVTLFKTSNLPLTLRCLHCPLAYFAIDSPLPPDLRRFEAHLVDETWQQTALDAVWPKSMTELSEVASTLGVLGHDFVNRFPNVSSLNLSYIVTQKLCENTSFDFFHQNWPQTLKTVNLTSVFEPYASKVPLPASLTVLKARSVNPTRLRNISRLESLQLSAGAPPFPPDYQPEDWCALPRSLVHLKCHSWMLGPPESLGSLRRLMALNILDLTTTDEWLNMIDLTGMWPESAEELRIEGPEMHYVQWMSSLSDLVHLKSLDLHTPRVKSDCAVKFEWLPRGLKKLQICWQPLNGFYGLPEGLEQLSARPSTVPNAYSIRCCQGLPKNLTLLSISGLPSDTNAMLALLPPKLANFNFNDVLEPMRTDFLRQYYDNPIWEGVMDPIFTKSP